eukprot:gene16762-biopygen336
MRTLSPSGPWRHLRTSPMSQRPIYSRRALALARPARQGESPTAERLPRAHLCTSARQPAALLCPWLCAGIAAQRLRRVSAPPTKTRADCPLCNPLCARHRRRAAEKGDGVSQMNLIFFHRWEDQNGGKHMSPSAL